MPFLCRHAAGPRCTQLHLCTRAVKPAEHYCLAAHGSHQSVRPVVDESS